MAVKAFLVRQIYYTDCQIKVYFILEIHAILFSNVIFSLFFSELQQVGLGEEKHKSLTFLWNDLHVFQVEDRWQHTRWYFGYNIVRQIAVEEKNYLIYSERERERELKNKKGKKKTKLKLKVTDVTPDIIE